jgi:hypothetical protein
MIPVRIALNSRIGERPRHDRGRGRHEHHLEEPVGCGRVAGAEVGALLRERRAVVGAPDAEAADEAAVDAVIHQLVADQIEQDAGDRIDRDVLEQLRADAALAHQACLEHCETGRHPHHEKAAHQKRERVEHELGLGGHAGFLCRRRLHEQAQRGSDPSRHLGIPQHPVFSVVDPDTGTTAGERHQPRPGRTGEQAACQSRRTAAIGGIVASGLPR